MSTAASVITLPTSDNLYNADPFKQMAIPLKAGSEVSEGNCNELFLGFSTLFANELIENSAASWVDTSSSPAFLYTPTDCHPTMRHHVSEMNIHSGEEADRVNTTFLSIHTHPTSAHPQSPIACRLSLYLPSDHTLDEEMLNVLTNVFDQFRSTAQTAFRGEGFGYNAAIASTTEIPYKERTLAAQGTNVVSWSSDEAPDIARLAFQVLQEEDAEHVGCEMCNIGFSTYYSNPVISETGSHVEMTLSFTTLSDFSTKPIYTLTVEATVFQVYNPGFSEQVELLEEEALNCVNNAMGIFQLSLAPEHVTSQKEKYILPAEEASPFTPILNAAAHRVITPAAAAVVIPTNKGANPFGEPKEFSFNDVFSDHLDDCEGDAGISVFDYPTAFSAHPYGDGGGATLSAFDLSVISDALPPYIDRPTDQHLPPKALPSHPDVMEDSVDGSDYDDGGGDAVEAVPDFAEPYDDGAVGDPYNSHSDSIDPRSSIDPDDL